MKCDHCPLAGDERDCPAVTLPHPRYCQLVDPDHPHHHAGYIPIIRGEAPPPVKPNPPSFFRKAANFAVAATTHIVNGRPQAPPEEQRRRIALCESCPLFDHAGRSCPLCGCNMDMKTTWADMACGDTPPKWTAVAGGPDDR